MALELPRFIAIKSVFLEHYAHSSIKSGRYRDYVCLGEENVFSPYAKIEVQKAKIDNNLVHLRFCYSNKYCTVKQDPGTVGKGNLIVASSDQPEEDRFKLSCKMFQPMLHDNCLYFLHVSNRIQLVRPYLANVDEKARIPLEFNGCLGLDNEASLFFELLSHNYSRLMNCAFSHVDWDTLVITAKHLAFKGYNNQYLRSAWFQRHEYLDFSSEDCGKETTAYEVTMKSDGHLRIKSKFFGKFWRRSPNWIWGDSTDDVGDGIDTLFWPIKVDDNTIALRNAGNNSFCSSLTTEGMTDCLNAAVSTITTEARLKAEELVFEREIIDVVYCMNHDRIFNQRPFVAGTGAATNNTQELATLAIRISYQETSSYSFSNSLSIMTGVKTTIKTGFLRIFEGSIEISAEIRSSLQWNRTRTETKTAEATYQAVVPPMSIIKVNYVATQGTCNVPFSYTQRDKLSSDGSFVTTRHIDGFYTGVNYDSFHFKQNVVETGMKIDKKTIEPMTPKGCSACVFN